MDLHKEWETLASYTRAIERRAWSYIETLGNDDRPCGAVELQLLNGLMFANDSAYDFIEKCAERQTKGFGELRARLLRVRRVTAEQFIPGPTEIDRIEKRKVQLLIKDWAISIGLIEADVTRLLTDIELWIGSKTELPFRHLQRLLIVDPSFRAKWTAAYKVREAACERLGGAHFLWHGLWAFKVDAHGARTDLVTYEPVDEHAVGASGAALV